jgi:hypothetical protein
MGFSYRLCCRVVFNGTKHISSPKWSSAWLSTKLVLWIICWLIEPLYSSFSFGVLNEIDLILQSISATERESGCLQLRSVVSGDHQQSTPNWRDRASRANLPLPMGMTSSHWLLNYILIFYVLSLGITTDVMHWDLYWFICNALEYAGQSISACLT